ncbi:hypothetical protein MATL_G00100600 [Megalops atlanticus]|uniref:Uncharacterized protein n=1 Tax=Megalops atlanticus TaxID=7932 RepID=A0A9D3TEZ0_MEGAT|nr:hypothetical protein MATL_G00100600 [Megalops atlanticus]
MLGMDRSSTSMATSKVLGSGLVVGGAGAEEPKQTLVFFAFLLWLLLPRLWHDGSLLSRSMASVSRSATALGSSTKEAVVLIRLSMSSWMSSIVVVAITTPL